MSEIPKFRSAEKKYLLDGYEIKGMADVVQLGNNPYAYIARKIDELAMAEDQPEEVEIVVELLSDIENDLQILRENKLVPICELLAPLIDQGNESETGLKIIYTLCKEAGFSKEVMLEAIGIQSGDRSLTQLNNKTYEKYLREVYS